MNYIENIYVCLAAPFVIASICLDRSNRRVTAFALVGMTVCLLSSYISTFLMGVQGMGTEMAAISITPIVEELMKFLPVVFYLVVFEPKRGTAVSALLMIYIGFATFENVCYLTQNGAGQLMFLVIRGFGTGTMHVVCGMIMAIGLLFLWDHGWLRIAGLFGLISLAITYHGIYNMMVSQPGRIAVAGYLIPAATVVVVLLFREKILNKAYE